MTAIIGERRAASAMSSRRGSSASAWRKWRKSKKEENGERKAAAGRRQVTAASKKSVNVWRKHQQSNELAWRYHQRWRPPWQWQQHQRQHMAKISGSGGEKNIVWRNIWRSIEASKNWRVIMAKSSEKKHLWHETSTLGNHGSVAWRVATLCGGVRGGGLQARESAAKK